jgi:hypothetical protein
VILAVLLTPEMRRRISRSVAIKNSVAYQCD